MELQIFKNKFMRSIYRLEERLDKIRDILLSEAEENELEESWAEYNWPQFQNIALKHIEGLAKDADKIYYFIVEDEHPCDSEPGEQIVYESELFRDLHALLDNINVIAYDFGHSYEKLTGDCLERTENPYKQDNASGLTDYIMEELDILVEDAGEILEYLTNDGCCEASPEGAR